MERPAGYWHIGTLARVARASTSAWKGGALKENGSVKGLLVTEDLHHLDGCRAACHTAVHSMVLVIALSLADAVTG